MSVATEDRLVLKLHDRVIHARVIRSGRKTLGITVTPEGDVLVRAPEVASDERLLERVERRSGWISANLADVESYDPRPVSRVWRNGETHRYLGRQYLLKVARGESTGVMLCRPHLVVTVDTPICAELVKTQMLHWYRRRAEIIFTQRWEKCAERTEALGIKAEGFGIRRMSRRWGSCTASGRILLNLDLIQAPTECIDYVMLHELCHRARMRHDTAFTRLLDRIEPNWRRLKAKLDRCEIASFAEKL